MADITTLPGATQPPAPLPLIPLALLSELRWRVREEDAPPAVVLNPAATSLSLASAARASAQHIFNMASAWEGVGDAGDVTPMEVAGAFVPIIEQQAILLDRLVEMLDPRKPPNGAPAS